MPPSWNWCKIQVIEPLRVIYRWIDKEKLRILAKTRGLYLTPLQNGGHLKISVYDKFGLFCNGDSTDSSTVNKSS